MFPPNFVLRIEGYLMMVSEGSHDKDVRSENIFEMCLSTEKI